MLRILEDVSAEADSKWPCLCVAPGRPSEENENGWIHLPMAAQHRCRAEEGCGWLCPLAHGRENQPVLSSGAPSCWWLSSPLDWGWGVASILQQLDPSASQKADGANNHLLLRPTVHSKGPSWHAPALSELVQCPQPAGRGRSPACVVGGVSSTAAHPIVYLTEFILSVLWKAHNGVSCHGSILPGERRFREQLC